MSHKYGTCTVEDCGRPARSRKSGLCGTHYERLRRTGSVGDGTPVYKCGRAPGFAGTLEERFERKVQRNANSWGCDIWTGAKGNAGYGRINTERTNGKAKALRAHVVAWEWKNGPVPPGYELDHFRFPEACIGPGCCNPDHVRPATHEENSLRSLTAPPAINARKTRCKNGHPFDVFRLKHGRPVRECSICIKGGGAQ